MKKRMIIMLISVAVVFGGVAGFQQFKATMMAQWLAGNGQPPATVTAIEATFDAWQTEVRAVGTLRAVQGIDLVTERAGTIEKILFHSGDVVKEGQLLLVLDSAEEKAQLNAAKAALELAKQTLKRDEAQLKVKAISQAQLDMDEADLKAKQAYVKQWQAVVSKLEIRAPFSGRLGVSNINVGQLMQVGEKIASLQNSEKMLIDFHVPQKALAVVAVGQSVALQTNTYEGKTFTGQILAIDTVVAANTRNVLVEAELDNSKGDLVPGMFAEVKIKAGQSKRYLTLPQTAITFNAYGATVFLVKAGEAAEDGTAGLPIAEQIFVQTGETRGDQVAIVSGIEAGMQVVTSGQMKLKNGTPLIINNSHEPTNEQAPTPQEG